MTTNERQVLQSLQSRIEKLKTLLGQHPCPEPDSPFSVWHDYLSTMKETAGHASNDMHTIACLLAKEYLLHKLVMRPYDALKNPHGRTGLDIDEQTADGKRVIAEIKTTTPAMGNTKNVGSQQKTVLVKDLKRLDVTHSDFKFFFLTNSITFQVVRNKNAFDITGVTVVLLPSGEEYSAT